MKIHLANQNDIRVYFPDSQKRPHVIDLGQKYLAYEQTRPVKKQNLFTPIIQDLLQQILECENNIAEGEAQRAVASDKVTKLEQRSKELVASMLKTIDAAFPDQPAKAQEWGFTTKKETANIRTPRNQKERLAVMKRYIAKEESRPEEERFTIPALAEVIDNFQTYRAAVYTRDDGQYQRQAHVNTSKALTKELAQYLQLAAGVIVGYDYRLKVSRDLQRWGYKVVEYRRGRKTETNDAAPTDDSTNGSTNGSSASDVVTNLTDQDD
ncbi:MAG TPA: hypothetical protein P5526_26905 [Anaerolineae bacterium]|nr:hypothetical protein [Anaerolineae bacterium]MCB0223670.1 hypothetical protein [Anaerolineae bacterium]MCB9108155.1 hypothetical protein [Anaerolineales bacterium]HRV95813.1 hypothetical protein [Anaerolineae bacterium]